jgi:cell wall-associated NlpC family hydrolase
MSRLLVLAVLTLTVAACASGPPVAPQETAPSTPGRTGSGKNGPGSGGTGGNAETEPGNAEVMPGATNAPVAPLPANEAMVATARSMLGVPYSFGGTEPDGFDCSGLVVYAANSIGISLPRTAREQLRIGTPVARDHLHAGDLVFLRLKRRQLHVGIVVDATHFIHAPSRGGRVRIDSLEARPYNHAYTAARRIITAPLVASPIVTPPIVTPPIVTSPIVTSP